MSGGRQKKLQRVILYVADDAFSSDMGSQRAIHTFNSFKNFCGRMSSMQQACRPAY